MRLNLELIFNRIVKVSLLSGTLLLTTVMPTSAEVVKATTQLEDKLYRKAVYFYFTGNYGEALNQINLNRQRFKGETSRSQLFEAGLQVTVGLHQQAKVSLQELQKKQTLSDETRVIKPNNQKSQSTTSSAELMLIALLQLAEQQIQQGDNKTARQTLSQITSVSSAYKEQYKLLNQLAYWPESPIQSVVYTEVQSSAKSEQNNAEAASTGKSFSDAYIQLNHALLLMEQGEFEKAKPLLTKIKNTLWLPPSKTFWQSLFNASSDEKNADAIANMSDAQIQQQAVNDYAQLLLAQMYVKQEHYEAAYYELKNFPQDSPYSESALFIFAFSAQKIKQYTMSRKLFNVVQERFPYSNLGWQSALLLAEQVVEQLSLGEGMTSYQNAERIFEQRLTELAGFQQVFAASDNLLNFSAIKSSIALAKDKSEDKFDEKAEVVVESSMPFFITDAYSTDSIWLQKALSDNALQADFQILVELDLMTKHLQEQQHKNLWLKDTLALNSKRKAKVTDVQQQAHYRAIILALSNKKKQLAKIIAEAETEQDGEAFANQAQEKWLLGIQKSKQGITAIKGSRNTAKYQERVQRIEGVLAWQLQQSLPERLWQHKKQLKEIEQLLAHAEQQRSHFVGLTDSMSLLTGLSNRIESSATDIKIQLSNVAKLRAKTSNKIQKNVQLFVVNQRALLEQHLLTSRHEMAAVLERMAKLDKRIERQLSPSTQKAYTEKINFNDSANADVNSKANRENNANETTKANLLAELQQKGAL